MAFSPVQVDALGAGAHSCTFGGADGSMNGAYPGPFSDGPTNRYLVLGDVVNFKLRCYKSTDQGNSWVEQDAGNAPAIAKDAGSPSPGTFQLWCSCYDQANKIIYSVFWHPTFKLAIKPFQIGVGWQPTVISALGYKFASNFDRSGADLACEFRPSDNVVWALHEDLNAGGATACEVYGLKFACSTSTWDVATTLLAGVGGDGLVWHIAGIRRDSAGNLHMVGDNYKDNTPNNMQTWQLWHRVIHPDNSLSATQIVQSVGWDGTHVQEFTQISFPAISTTDKILFTFLNGPAGLPFSAPNGVYVARGQAADSPVWTIEAPPPIQLPLAVGGGGLTMLMGAISDRGVDYVFYNYYTNGANTATFAIITNTGAGWSAEQVLGTIDTSGAGTYVAAGVCIPSVTGSWGLVFELIPTVPGTFGIGFLAGGAAAGQITLTFKGKKQYGTGI